MFREPSSRAVLAVRAVKAAVTSGLVATAIVVSLGGATASPADAERVHTDVRCVGAAGQTIVRTRDGETRAVPFERGWRVFRGERPGTLVVVCPD